MMKAGQQHQKQLSDIMEDLTCSGGGGEERRRRAMMNAADVDVEKPKPIRLSTKNSSTSSSASVSAPLSVTSRMYDLDGDGKLNETERQLRQMHTTNTTTNGVVDPQHLPGGLDIHKVYDLLLQQRELNTRVFNLKKFTFCLILLVIVLSLANLGTAFVAVHLSKDTEIDNDTGILLDRYSHKIIQTDTVVRHVQAVQQVDRRQRRRNQQQQSSSTTTKSATATTIAKQEAANLFNYCSQGSAIMDVIDNNDNNHGHKILTICPADFYSQWDDSTYFFVRDDKILHIQCGGDGGNEEEEEYCSMSGSMLLSLQPSSSSSLMGGAGEGQDEDDEDNPYLIPSYQQVLYAPYEDGTLNSNIQQLAIATAAANAAPSTAYLANFGAHNKSSHSICNRVSLNDTTTVTSSTTKIESSSSSPFLSSQSDTGKILATRYTPGSEFIYKFSFLLLDWEPYDADTMGSSPPPPMDIIWQFQHTLGEPDAMLGIRRNSLYIRYGKSTSRFRSEALIMDDLLTKHRNEWIDIEIHIKWAYEVDNGFIRLRVGSSDGKPKNNDNDNDNGNDNDNDDMVFQIENYKTFTDNGSGDYGYIKWGLDRLLSTMENTPSSMYERIVCHDDIEITSVTYK